MTRVLLTAGLIACCAIAYAQGGDEQLPPPGMWGAIVTDPPPPPPPQPATSLQARVAFRANELGQIVLRLEAVGVPGAGFLVGVVRPGTSRPVVLTTGALDVEGRWSFERVLTKPQARALSQSELVFLSR